MENKMNWMFDEHSCTDFDCKYNNQGICMIGFSYKGNVKGQCEQFKERKESK